MRDNYEAIQKLGVEIYGVSFDSVESQEKFVDKEKLPFSLISDTEGKIVKAFGVPSKGKFASRRAFLLRDGKVVWADTKGATKTQADDVLKAVKALK